MFLYAFAAYVRRPFSLKRRDFDAISLFCLRAGSSVHETLCLLRDIYRLQASPSIYHSADGNDGAEPSIWRINPAALASIRCFPPRGLGPYKMVYLYKPAYEREKQLREAGIPFPVALRHILCDLYAFRGWEGQADLILQEHSPQAAAMRLAEYILQSEDYAEETIW